MWSWNRNNFKQRLSPLTSGIAAMVRRRLECLQQPPSVNAPLVMVEGSWRYVDCIDASTRSRSISTSKIAAIHDCQKKLQHVGALQEKPRDCHSAQWGAPNSIASNIDEKSLFRDETIDCDNLKLLIASSGCCSLLVNIAFWSPRDDSVRSD